MSQSSSTTSCSTGDAVLGAQEPGALRGDDGDVAVARELDGARLAEERGGVRGEERLALGEADDHRALQPGADEHARVVAVDDDEGEVALELPVREPHGLDEIAVVVLLDQVRDRLGVRLGREDVAELGEALAQLAVVLDDPVEDDRELLGVLGGERVRVLLGDAAVRRPARVTEPGRRGRAVHAGALLEVLEVPDGPRVARGRRSRAARSRPSRSPRYSRRSRPWSRSGLHSRGPTYPMIPHMLVSFARRLRRNRVPSPDGHPVCRDFTAPGPPVERVRRC